MELETAMVLMLGLVAGVLYKTLGPFWDKIKAGEIQKFDQRYAGTALLTMVIATLSAAYMYNAAAQALEAQGGATSFTAVVTFGFFWGSGLNYLLNRLLGPMKFLDKLLKKLRDRKKAIV